MGDARLLYNYKDCPLYARTGLYKADTQVPSSADRSEDVLRYNEIDRKIDRVSTSRSKNLGEADSGIYQRNHNTKYNFNLRIIKLLILVYQKPRYLICI